jgi:hypothetical protein
MGVRRQSTDPVAIVANAKAQQCLELRRTGMTYDNIGKIVGLNASNAYNHVKKAMDNARARISEDADVILAETLQNYESLLEKYLPLAMAGDLPTTDRVIKLLEARAKLVGVGGESERFPDVHFNIVFGRQEKLEAVEVVHRH